MTIFIIISLMVLVLTASIYWMVSLQKIPTETGAPLTAERASVTRFVESCLKEKLEESTFFIGVQGGYFRKASKSIPLPLPEYNLEVPISDSSTFLSQDEVQEELSLVFRQLAESCFNFSTYSISINAGEGWDVQTAVHPKKVQAEVHREVMIEKQSASSVIDIFVAEVESPLGQIHQAARKILEDSSCISCFSSILPEGFSIDETTFSLEDSIVSVRTISNGQFVYNFAEEMNYVEEEVSAAR